MPSGEPPSLEPSSPDASGAEPWLRGTETDLPAIARAVLHALQLAEEDLHKWCGNLSDADINARPANLAPVAFHIRHIARSLDRLLTYAEGRSLSDHQLAQLKTELDPKVTAANVTGTGVNGNRATRAELFSELDAALKGAASRVRALANANLEEARTVGKKHLPTTVGGLLVHVADHTQRHVGQAITTAKILGGMPERTTPKES